jgi:serine/threonine protein kinase/outer membrane protein assembly factor BamD (BamD/ComL family)
MTGTTLSHYRVLERLGEGATAVVFKAEDLSLGRPVALKLLPPNVTADLGKLARFQHEARTTSSLNHPNICTIYEIGEHEGRHFLVMEYLEGKPLSRIIDNRPLDGYRLIELAIQIADGLDTAHEARVIHRDLKPANIYVTDRDHVKLLDFGLAMLMPPSSSRSSSSSATWLSEPGGTGPYMSPEQTLGEPLDTRSDLFSLGVVLYEMATGSRPFTGTTHAALVDAIRNERAFPARDLNTGVRDELDHIINKALEKNRKLRYQTAADIATDLRRLKRDLDAGPSPAGRPIAVPSPVETPTPSADEGRSVLAQMRRQRWLVAQLAAAAMVGGILVALGLPSHRASRVETVIPAQHSAANRGAAPAFAPAAPSASTNTSPLRTTTADGSSPSGPNAGSPSSAGARATTTGTKPTVSLPAVSAEPRFGPDVSRAMKSAAAMADLHLYDQALETLQSAVGANATSPFAPAAYLMMASIQERRGKNEDAIAMYLDTAARYPNDPHAPEALVDMAAAILKSKHEARDQQAAKTYTDVATQYSASPWAARALMARAEIEQRRRAQQMDLLLGRRAPAALATYREIVQHHPASPEREHALWRLASLYEDLKRYDLSAEALRQLGSSYSATAYDAWFVAAEIYQKRLNDPVSARTAYAMVPPTSPHWNDAQKRLSTN